MNTPTITLPAAAPTVDDFHKHELVDRLHVINVMFDAVIRNHPATAPIAAAVDAVGAALGNLYQKAGQIGVSGTVADGDPLAASEPQITVSGPALQQVLSALNGPEHHIRELQFTRGSLFDNPIDKLLKQYNEQAGG